jgi:hypothetical protein
MMNLRSTPKHWRSIDHEMFPRLAERQAATKFPHLFYVRVGPSRVTVTADAFFVPPELAQRIYWTYQWYIDWWFAKENPARKRAPKWLAWGSIKDYVSLVVLREHAEWWIRLLDGCAPFTFNGFGLRRHPEGADGTMAAAEQTWRKAQHPVPGPWYPSGPGDAARIVDFLEDAASQLRRGDTDLAVWPVVNAGRMLRRYMESRRRRTREGSDPVLDLLPKL